MAYAVGDTISNSDYNGLLNNTASGTPNAGVAARGINYIAGTGAGVYGLGQTELNTVGSTDVIQAAQWNSLFTFMNNIQNHTNITALTSTTAAAAGDVIAIKAALETDLNALAAAVAGGSTNTTAVAAASTLLTASSGTRWNVSHVAEQSVTFTNANQLRWFFNAGGRIQINVTRTGNGDPSGATSKDSSVDQLITGLGNFKMGNTSCTRSGTTEILTGDQTIGACELTTSYQTVLTLTQDSGTYTTMYLQVEAKANAAAGSATQITFKTSIVDVDAGAGDDVYGGGNNPPGGFFAYANFIGTTNILLKKISPTSGTGLTTVYDVSSSAPVTNSSS